MSARTSRRRVLGTAAAPLAAVPVLPLTATPDEGADAELLRLAAEFQQQHRRCLALTIPFLDDDPPAEVAAKARALVPVQHDLAERVADMRAGTVAGLRAKAAVFLSFSGYTWDGDPEWTNHDELLVWSIARDLLGDAAARPPERRS